MLALPAPAAVVVRKPAPAINPLSEAVAQASSSRVVDLSGDPIADLAQVGREALREQVVYAVGPDAVIAAVNATKTAKIVALGVPNPAKISGDAVFLSVYPRLAGVLDFAATRLQVKSVGLLFSPGPNREIAAEFEKAAAAKGIRFVAAPVNSNGELVRVLKDTLPKVDALILAVDPLLFDRLSLRFIVESASQNRKPTIGFLPELPAFGVTVALSLDPSAIAAAAVEEGGRAAGRRVRELDFANVTASKKSAELLGLTMETLGANKVQ